jgi:hypothetical protein
MARASVLFGRLEAYNRLAFAPMGSFPSVVYWICLLQTEFLRFYVLASLTTAMTSKSTKSRTPACVSIGIFAWNEEAVIETTLRSLFQQSVFEELGRRGLRCEVLCVANGCTDRTAALAEQMFQKLALEHPYAGAFAWRVVNLRERGKVNAWNRFVHSFSAREARVLIMMDADILLAPAQTLWNMLQTLESDSQAHVAVDRPSKNILAKPRKSLNDRFSLAASNMTLAADGQLCGQLYCVRSEIARRIYLPKDLAACEDGFIKALVCTDFLTHGIEPTRIRVAQAAGHTFEAYTAPAAILKNQKRQIIGQTIVHILVDQYLSALPAGERLRLAERLRANDAEDPGWLKRLISLHLRRRRFFWRLYPGLFSQRFQHLKKLGLRKGLSCFPAAVASLLTSLISSFMAYRALRAGCTDYWPQARRGGGAVEHGGPQRAEATSQSSRPGDALRTAAPCLRLYLR